MTDDELIEIIEDAVSEVFMRSVPGKWMPGLPPAGRVTFVRARYWLRPMVEQPVHLHVVFGRADGALHDIERRALVVRRWTPNHESRRFVRVMREAGHACPNEIRVGQRVTFNGLLCDWWDPRG